MKELLGLVNPVKPHFGELIFICMRIDKFSDGPSTPSGPGCLLLTIGFTSPSHRKLELCHGFLIFFGGIPGWIGKNIMTLTEATLDLGCLVSPVFPPCKRGENDQQTFFRSKRKSSAALRTFGFVCHMLFGMFKP